MSGSATLLPAFLALLRRELVLAVRTPGTVANPLFFFLMVAALFPLGMTPERDGLSALAGGAIWIGALLAVLLSLDSLFKQDQDDGSLELLLLSPCPLPWLVLARVSGHWLTSGFLVTLLAPLLGLLLHLPGEAQGALFAGLLLGTPLLSLAGAIGAALTVRVQQGGVLMTLIALPLYIPVLIFGTGAVQAALAGLDYTGYLLWLASLLLMGLSLAPLAIAAALRAVCD